MWGPPAGTPSGRCWLFFGIVEGGGLSEPMQLLAATGKRETKTESYSCGPWAHGPSSEVPLGKERFVLLTGFREAEDSSGTQVQLQAQPEKSLFRLKCAARSREDAAVPRPVPRPHETRDCPGPTPGSPGPQGRVEGGAPKSPQEPPRQACCHCRSTHSWPTDKIRNRPPSVTSLGPYAVWAPRGSQPSLRLIFSPSTITLKIDFASSSCRGGP